MLPMILLMSRLPGGHSLHSTYSTRGGQTTLGYTQNTLHLLDATLNKMLQK